MAKDAKDEESKKWTRHDHHSGEANGLCNIFDNSQSWMIKVAGGERKGKSSLEVLDDIEIFTGKR